MHCGGVWGRKQAFLRWGGERKKSLPILPNMYYNVSDHYFAALVTVRAIGAPDRCRLGKVGGSKAIRNLRPGISRILNRI